MPDKILIVGAGIGGLTAALALMRQGFDIELFEAAAEIRDVGAGISLGATASRGLYSLGLEEALAISADRPEQASAALHFQTGEVLGGAFKDRQWKPEDLGPTHVIHRADLLAILERAVRDRKADAIHLGHVCHGFEQDEQGVRVRFANGCTAEGTALIACDGIRSLVRDQMFGREDPRFTGQIVYRFLVPMDQARPFMNESRAGPYIGPGRSLARYPIRHRTIVNCVAFVTAESWTEEGWSTRCSVDELQQLFAGWHDNVVGLASHAPVETTAKWALYDRDPRHVWVQGRVALLGDAAHAMLPFLGLGAAMAIEDAVVLGRAFARCGEAPAAFDLYQGARMGRANLMLLESRRQMETFREGPGARERRTLTTHQERMSYDPSTVPLEPRLFG